MLLFTHDKILTLGNRESTRGLMKQLKGLHFRKNIVKLI